MAQITTGIRSILSVPLIYSSFQNAVGASKFRKTLCREYVRAATGDVIVDVGCGPAEILDLLPQSTRYYGFDLSEHYVQAARKRFRDRGLFQCRDIGDLGSDDLPPCDVALAIGLLHHLDDEPARRLIDHLKERLAPGGRLITIDPAYWPNQSPVARLLISQDRGRNVRQGEDYRQLVPPGFSDVKLIRRDDLLHIPYSHAILECSK